MDRRQFLAATAAAPMTFASNRAIGANDTIRVAVIGVNGRGHSHLEGFEPLENVEVSTIVDPDLDVAKEMAEVEATLAGLEKTSNGFFDTVDIEHYDAFPGQAGKFSFSQLMLNRNGSGIILTSLTSAQGSKVFAKILQNGRSDIPLGREEQDLLSRHTRS